MKDYYYILGLTRTSTETDIKSAYRKLSVKFHPDKNDGDKFFEERFKDIQEAYETLSNSIKKASYDLKFQSGQPSNNNDSFNKYEEELKKKFDEELRKKEDEIKRKYQTPEQRQAEENEIKRQQTEARIKAERIAEENRIKKQREDTLKAIEENKTLLSKKESERVALENRIRIINSEIPTIKRLIENLNDKLNSNSYGKSNNDSQLFSFRPGELEPIKVELDKIKKTVIESERLMCLHILLSYAKGFSVDSKYAEKYPHLLNLVLKEKIKHTPFYYVYYRLNKTATPVKQFENEVIKLFNN